MCNFLQSLLNTYLIIYFNTKNSQDKNKKQKHTFFEVGHYFWPQLESMTELSVLTKLLAEDEQIYE